MISTPLSIKSATWKKEGEFNKEWLILDFVNVVAHIFLKEKRYHYNLDKLWGDGNNIIEK